MDGGAEPHSTCQNLEKG
uniref:Uncharacterized protein n=1 Tax=Arundo donax TaxID=35708 RepID=A0A0A8Y6S8_ARUDO